MPREERLMHQLNPEEVRGIGNAIGAMQRLAGLPLDDDAEVTMDLRLARNILKALVVLINTSREALTDMQLPSRTEVAPAVTVTDIINIYKKKEQG